MTGTFCERGWHNGCNAKKCECICHIERRISARAKLKMLSNKIANDFRGLVMTPAEVKRLSVTITAEFESKK